MASSPLSFLLLSEKLKLWRTLLAFSFPFLVSVVSGSANETSVTSVSSAYDELSSHGLPRGLLPTTVTEYVVNSDGSFVVRLSGKCYTSVKKGTIGVYFSPVLTGFLGESSLSSLKGISVNPPYSRWLWIAVSNIYVDQPSTNKVHFASYIGIQKDLDTSEFASPLICSSSSPSSSSSSDNDERDKKDSFFGFWGVFSNLFLVLWEAMEEALGWTLGTREWSNFRHLKLSQFECHNLFFGGMARDGTRLVIENLHLFLGFNIYFSVNERLEFR